MPKKESKRRCIIYYPTMKALLYAVEKLRTRYPEDYIRIVSRTALERVIESAKTAAHYTHGSCTARKVAAAAALFYEIIAGHPLTDGNKRLATLMLKAFLIKNRLRRPIAYNAAIKVARGEWGFEEVHNWLRNAIRGGG